MNIFETFINVIINNAHNFLKNISKFERSHDFQSWLVDIIIAIQIFNSFEILNNDTFSNEVTIETRFALQNKAWIFAQTFVKNFIFNVVNREVKKFIQQKAISYLMIIELKNKFTRKDDSRVIEIHIAFRVITFATCFNIHDFAINYALSTTIFEQYMTNTLFVFKRWIFISWTISLMFTTHSSQIFWSRTTIS